MEFSTLQTIRRELHQIPELGFQEVKTQQYILNTIKAMQTDRVDIKTWKTGVMVRVTGENPRKTIGFRCDMDGLPITEQTGYPFQSMHEGNMHACGHDFHMTIALGALKKMIDEPINDNIVFLFQPAEEGPGGALPMIQPEILGEWKPNVIFALHIAPELPVGTVSSRPGLLFANTSELFIDFTGKGGHAAYPHLTRDMGVAASNFVVEMQQVVSRGVAPLESAVVTIGKIESGFVQNAIAETARLEGTIRTLEPATIDVVKEKLEKLMRGFEISHECSIHVDYGSNYYQVYNDQKWVDLFAETMQRSEISYQEANPAMTGEDFGYMLKEIPGFMFWLGVNSPYGLHNAQLQPDESALEAGVQTVVDSIKAMSA
ncbi:N-acetyldiaminopimelate deacetylase [Lentibacillus halodurans]|uniref:N-acetyldiaminopimelate deacetylase n=1 Tax=Lentibacillus halodurans TaxID=237679 RepID=A0A1I1AG29_9BACI|nr:N-acetyldiaminopimelate deacetylase [Lentibacillus halodurans]SFB35440.1 N-acetyldiaminopimelate deacetylase [Lentibacillus halodurans]